MVAEKKTKTVSQTSTKEPPVATKAAPEKPVAEKVAPKKPATEKAAPKKPVVAKTAPKKPAAEKAAPKKAAAKKVTETMVIQAMGNEWDVAAIKEQVIAAYVAGGHKQSGISSLTVYFKPEERKAYYVIDGETGSVDI